MGNPSESEKTEVIVGPDAIGTKQSVSGQPESIDDIKTLLETERSARAAVEAEASKRAAAITELNAATGSVKKSLAEAVAAYKVLVVRSNPGIPAELISGENIEAINRSLETALSIISRVRKSFDAEIASGKVPAGAPARTAPDLESLSPREKIQYAISKGDKR